MLNPARPDLEPVVVGPASEIGEVFAAVELGGALLVLASGGSFVLRDASWVPSPLADGLDGPIRDAALVPTSTGRGDGDLWIATDASLYRVVGMEAERLSLDGEDLSDLELAVTRRPEGPALWVRLADRVLEIYEDRTGVLRTVALSLEVMPTRIAGDAGGTGWLVLEGRLFSIGVDRQLVDRGLAVDRLLGAEGSETLWAFGPDGARLYDTPPGGGVEAYEVEGVTIGADDRVALAADGSIFVSASTVTRYAPRRDARVDGPLDGALLAVPQTFLIEAEGSPEVAAELDGSSIDVQTEPLRVELDPSTLDDGSHVLRIEVRYDDGTLPVETRRNFEVVSNASWSEHVQPLYDTHCSACHGSEGPANTRLDAREDWERIYAAILANVSEGRMPLGRPPLSQREIALIEAWGVSGFSE